MATATAVMTEAAFPQGKDMTQRRFHTYGTVAISASPATYATGGLALTFAAPVFDVASQTPIQNDFESVGGSGYNYTWNKSTNTLQIFTGSAAQSPMAELTNGASIPAAVSGDTIAYHAQFLKSV